VEAAAPARAERRPAFTASIGYRGTAVSPRMLVITAAAAWAAGFAALAALRYDAFLNKRFDLGNFTQAVWSTAHGRPLETTEVAGEQISRLAVHVDPLLMLFAPFWWIWPSPVMLGVVQAVAVALGALPVFWLARKHVGSERAAAYLALVYLLYPPLHWNVLNEFDPQMIAVPLLLFAIWYLDEDRLLLFAVFAVAAAASREQIPLLIGGLGVWYALRTRRLRVGGSIAGVGVAWTALAFWVVIPHFSGGGSPFESRYAAVGGSPTGIAETLVTDPLRILEAATNGNDVLFLALMFGPLLGLCALSPVVLLAALPELALLLLSSRATDASIGGKLASPLIPFAIVATVFGIARLGRHAASAAALVLVAVSIGLIFGPLPHLGEYGGLSASDGRTRAAQKAVDLVPQGAPVSATNRLAAHLSNRRYVYSFPVVARADWIVVDESDWWLPNVRPGEARDGFAVAVTDLSEQPGRLRRALAAVTANPRWRLAFDEAGVLVFRRV
jgi:uncharacterized membrane protein